MFSSALCFNIFAQSGDISNGSKTLRKDTTAIKSVKAEFSLEKNENEYPMKVSSTVQQQRTKETVLWEIQTMEEKLRLVQTDPELDKKAKKNGWYARTNAQIALLKEELLNFSN